MSRPPRSGRPRSSGTPLPAPGRRPKKRLGQHFLTDPRILARIVDALAPEPRDTVIEIGPGPGGLTAPLVARAGRVIAIELDRDLADALRDRYRDETRLSVIAADVLVTSLAELAGGPYLLVGNVPYYITTPIVFHALTPPRAGRMVFLVQREVADRLTAAPGTEAYGALTVNVHAVARAELVFRVSAGAFTPPPKVESAVVRITPLAQPRVGDAEVDGFRAFVQRVFGMRRKQMRRVVRELTGLNESAADAVLAGQGIASAVRGETLPVETFVALYRTIADRLTVGTLTPDS